MIIEQTVEIPANHRLVIDVPSEVPAGRAKMELVFTSLTDLPPQEERKTGIRLDKQMIDELLQDEVLRSLTGILHTEMSIDEIRAERLKKYDHTD